MANGIRTGDLCGFNKGRSSKFCEGSRVWQRSKEGRRIYWPKRCRNNNKDENNRPKTLNDKNQQASSQKFRQLKPHYQMQLNVLSWILNSFKYCYQALIILFNTNHLFANSLDGFKYCYRTTFDPQPLTSSTFKLNHCLPQEQFEE